MHSPEAISGEQDGGGSDVLAKMPDFYEFRASNSKDGSSNSETESGQEQKKQEAFNNLVVFFDKNSSIKQTLGRLAPDYRYSYGGNVEKYANTLYSGFLDIRNDLENVMDRLYPSDEFKKRLDQIQQDVVNSGLDFGRLSETYQRDFSDISEEFNQKIRRENIGYYMFSNSHSLDKDARSINEMLRLVHTSVVNNEKFLQSLPVLAQNESGYHFLYGTANSENAVARGIFDNLEDDDFHTDIVSVDSNRTIMMVRDRGHALTIDINKEKNGKYFVDYFVPKICNVDKVNELRGVRKIEKVDGENQILNFTTGSFFIDSETEVAEEIIDFINSVPTDEDIER